MASDELKSFKVGDKVKKPVEPPRPGAKAEPTLIRGSWRIGRTRPSAASTSTRASDANAGYRSA